MTALTREEIAHARHHTYTLLSRIYLEGPVPELLPYIEALPALAGRLPPGPDPDELAAAHYRLFGLNVFPYESVFLDPSGLLGGRVSAQVATRYDTDGYRPAADVAPDHVGHQLGLLAHLAAAEADAWEDGREQIAQEMQQRQQSFLAGHLARWLPPLLAALEAQDDAFYRATAALTWDLVGDHAREEPVSWSLPPRPSLLAEEGTGLRQIAASLLAPPLSGFFLSRTAISALARQQALPRGFGNRQQLLLNLLRSAAQYDQFPTLVTALRETVAAWEQAYAAQVEAAPTLATTVTVWQARLQETGEMLDGLAEAAVAALQDG